MKQILILLLTILLVMLSGCTKTGKEKEDTERETINTKEVTPSLNKEIENPYFFSKETTEQTYDGSFLFDESTETKARLKIQEIMNTEKASLYELMLEPLTGVPRERLSMGYFYVTEDMIYKTEPTVVNLRQLRKDQLPEGSIIVCQEEELEDTLTSDKAGGHHYILAEGDRREYHSYDKSVETGYFETMIWEKGKGLIYYRNGFGADRDSVTLLLEGYEDTLDIGENDNDLIPLSEQELGEFTTFLQQWDNQGFVTCEYETPNELDINAVIYSGAGSLSTEDSRYKEIKNKLGDLDGGDLFIYTTASLNQFLMDKLGITMEDLAMGLVYPYVAEEDAYYQEVFDTNYVMPSCISGSQDSEYVYLNYTTIYENGEWELVLKKEGDDFLFVSNISKSARENRSYVEEVLNTAYRFSMLESSNYYFYYDDMSGTLVYAVDKEGEYIRTLYFQDRECIFIQIDDGKIGPTEGYFKDIGEPILEEFDNVYKFYNDERGYLKIPSQAKDVNEFIMEGWHLLEYYDGLALARGDLNQDGIEDVAFVLEMDASGYFPSYRYLVIAFADETGTYTISEVAKDAILLADEGGVWGDPFDGIAIEKGSIFLKFYGGSNWRWGYSYQFSYREQDWYLIGATESNIFTGNNSGTIIDYNLLTGDYILTEYAEDGSETVSKGNYDKYFWYRLEDFDPEQDVFNFE